MCLHLQGEHYSTDQVSPSFIQEIPLINQLNMFHIGQYLDDTPGIVSGYCKNHLSPSSCICICKCICIFKCICINIHIYIHIHLSVDGPKNISYVTIYRDSSVALGTSVNLVICGDTLQPGIYTKRSASYMATHLSNRESTGALAPQETLLLRLAPLGPFRGLPIFARLCHLIAQLAL